MLYRGVHATIGRTPLVELRRIGENGARLLAKLELRNPGGSVKDRIAAAMVEDAERRGTLAPGGTIVEATSGNTGIALAFVAATKGYTLHVTMPERMSKERLTLLRYLGAQVTLTPGALMGEAVEKAEALRREIPGAVALDQFRNPANPEAHRDTTGREIWEDAAGEVDVFVAGVGTGGTITGVGELLKARKPAVRIVAVEPASAAVLSGRRAANHMIQGIGAGFVPPLLNRAIVDEVVPVSDDEAFAHARRLAREEGISAGVSSGATLAAALRIARRPENEGKTIVFMVCDGGERYIHGPLVNELLGRVKGLTSRGAPLPSRPGSLSFRDVLASAPLQGLRLLVIEDDETIRSALSDLLRDEGATLATASNGREGLEELRASAPPDLILLDLMMPVMDGWQFRVEQRADQALAGIPLIAMSADRSAKAHAIAADAYVAKPLDFAALIGNIRNVVDEATRKRRAAADSTAAFALMAAEIAHEINNPLTYVLANLHVLAEKFPPGSHDPELAELHDLVADAVEGAERIRRVVKQAQKDPLALRQH